MKFKNFDVYLAYLVLFFLKKKKCHFPKWLCQSKMSKCGERKLLGSYTPVSVPFILSQYKVNSFQVKTQLSLNLIEYLLCLKGVIYCFSWVQGTQLKKHGDFYLHIIFMLKNCGIFALKINCFYSH